jgi:hypothetical protein
MTSKDRLRAVFCLKIDEPSRRVPFGYDVRMFHKLIAVAALTVLAFMVYVRRSRRSNTGRRYRRHPVLNLLSRLRFSYDRHGRIQDGIQKMAGGAIGIAAGRAIFYFAEANRWFQN